MKATISIGLIAIVITSGLFFAPESVSAQSCAAYLSWEDSNSTQNFGTLTNEKTAFRFYATSTTQLDQISMILWRSSSTDPGDFVYLTIVEDVVTIPEAYGKPTGAVIATSSQLLPEYPPDQSNADDIFTFDGEVMTGGKYYWVVLNRTGAVSDTLFYSAQIYSGAGGPAEARNRTLDDGSWSDPSTAVSLAGFTINACFFFTSLQSFSVPTSTLTIGFSTSTNDCSVYSGGLFSSSTLQALGCYAENVGYNIVNFLFYPNTGLTFFNERVNDFTNVFPFSLVFGTLEQIHESAENKSGSGTISIPLGFSSTSISISSSTIKSFVGISTYETVRSTQDAFLWAVLGIAIFSIIF